MANNPITKAQTVRPIKPSGTGNSKTRRFTVTTTLTEMTIAPRITQGIFKNVGSNNIRLKFNASGSNFWTLKPDEVSPKVLINNTTVEHISIGGDSVLECILEG